MAECGRSHLLWASVFALCLTAYATASLAAGCEAPCIGYTLSSDTEAGFVHSAPDTGNGQFAPVLDADFTFAPVQRLNLVTSLTYEDLADRAPGELSQFADYGLYAVQLYASVDLDRLRGKAGKLDPTFGLATAELSGIHATDLLGSYDLTERIGGEIAIDFNALALSHTLTASLFTVDRSVLSGAIFASRGRTRLADGGPGNRKGAASLAVTLDGCSNAAPADCYADGDFGYRIGILGQRAGLASEEQIEEALTPADERGLLLAGTWRHALGEDLNLRLLGEVAYFRNFETGPDDALFTTISAGLEWDRWTLESTFTMQDVLAKEGPAGRAYLVDLGVDYALPRPVSFGGEQWVVGAGYGYAADAGGAETHNIGARLKIELDGSYDGRPSHDAYGPVGDGAEED